MNPIFSRFFACDIVCVISQTDLSGVRNQENQITNTVKEQVNISKYFRAKERIYKLILSIYNLLISINKKKLLEKFIL